MTLSETQRETHSQSDGSEAEAIRRCQQGDIAGLGPLVARYQTPGLRLAYLLTGDRGLADDIVQDSFLLAYRGFRGFRAGEPFGPWFYRIVTNAARQQRRYARHRREVSLDALSPEDGSEPRMGLGLGLGLAASGGDPYATRADPAAAAEQAEERTALLEALATLPQKQREAVVLRYYFGYSDGQIAELLGCRVGAVQQRLHAGRASLLQAIRKRSPWLLGAHARREGQ